MDIIFVAMVILIIISILFLLLFLSNSINKKTFKAEDGSLFKNQADLDVYNTLYNKTLPLFSIEEEKGSDQNLLGFEKSFLSNLSNGGFNDLKTLVKYRKQFKLLSDLINT